MVVQHNLTAMNANRMLAISQGSLSKSSEKLSSGYKVNRAADDAAGLSISEKMRKQIRGLTQASLNAEDGISAVQTAEGALTEVHDMLQRMNELAVKASNGTMSLDDRQTLQDEVDQLLTEIDRVAETTKFNETYLLKGDQRGKASITLNAHDAGLKGKFTVDGTYGAKASSTIASTDSIGTVYFTATLVNKATVNIGGTEYVIDTTRTTGDYKNTGSSSITMQDAANLMYDELVKANSIGLTVEDADDLIAFAVGTKGGNDNVRTSTDPNGNAEYTIDFAITKGHAETNKKLNFSLHVGADADMTNKIAVDIDSLDTKGLKIYDLNIKDEVGMAGTYAIDAIADAVAKVSAQRSKLGAIQNRLEHTIKNLDNIVENTQAAESQIRDTDMAKEMVTYSNNNILAQAGQSMLAQANQANQGVLSLLG